MELCYELRTDPQLAGDASKKGAKRFSHLAAPKYLVQRTLKLLLAPSRAAVHVDWTSKLWRQQAGNRSRGNSNGNRQGRD
jgi:hypothetical protein